MRSTALVILFGLTCSGCRPSGGGHDGRRRPLRVDDLPPGKSLAVRSDRRPWRYPLGVGQVITTSHYRIFASADNPVLMTCLPGFLEAAHEHYQKLTGLAPEPSAKPLEVYMLSSRQEWTHLTTHIVGQDAPHLSIVAGGYCHKGVGIYWDLRNRATLSIAAHEGLHQFLHHRMRHRLPLSIEEGLAVSAEGFHIRADENTVVFVPDHNPGRYDTLRRALVNRRWIPARRLLPMTAGDTIAGMTEDTLAWYAQVWALAMFLRTSEDYRKGFARLLSEAQSGRLHTAMNVPKDAYEELMQRGGHYTRTVALPVFRHYITADLDTFERRYVAFSRRLAALEQD